MCCARAAPGFPNKSPVIRSSSCWNVVRCNRLALPAMSPSSRTSPAIPCRSVPWVRLPAPRTDFGPARLIWFPRRACASTVPADAHSAPTIGGARCYGAWPVTIPRSTRNGTAIRDAGRSPTPRRGTASPNRWSATSTESSWRCRGRKRLMPRRGAWRTRVRTPGYLPADG
ncbi:Uncharacterised protein [Mycobacteroides abscessus subsp. abscessus]|nr:Uncharacterised protein [Mycobacteroides abscessus subsp. abscessus]